MTKSTGQLELAQRYATAFYSLAAKSLAPDVWTHDLSVLRQLSALPETLARQWHHPRLTRAQQVTIVAGVSREAKLSPLTQKLLSVLALRGRLTILAGLVDALEARQAAASGQVNVKVKSAVALTPMQADQLRQILVSALGASQVVLTTTVDPALLGGLVVDVGAHRIDASVRTRLDRLSRRLQNSTSSLDPVAMKEVA